MSVDVSVLFSEPKIPQFGAQRCEVLRHARFSALQRAENSSIQLLVVIPLVTVAFQCSSASRKFLNSVRSALPFGTCAFQCSSASRKFLNSISTKSDASANKSFSALQRAENSSIGDPGPGRYWHFGFSALQRAENSSIHAGRDEHLQPVRVSVLFSEPKIPQSKAHHA